MKNVYVDSRESLWLYRRFKKDLVTLDELLNDYEDIIVENEELKEQLDDLKKDLRDNYKPIPLEE